MLLSIFECRFDLENTIEADIDEVCDTSTHYYEFYETDMVRS